ncbi:bifunctional metallophosphatase/5'-nucleotidase [Paenibacillus sp. GCM10012303]|uniref:bifunctional metallophosphatase/5'-nucleotidase n=1 Tax=Paenibacillus sp. GCM10012303 TaxID=3317340 RepID=UPI003616D960
MKKKLASCMTGFVLAATLGATLYAAPAPAVGFEDIQASPYRQAILALQEKGVVERSDSFHPQRLLTKAEAAAMLVRALKLPQIHSLPAEDPTLKKSFRYEDPLGVIDDSFTMPSAPDIHSHWGSAYIEGALKVRADESDGGMYMPDQAISKSKWIGMIVRTVYGAEQQVNIADKAEELGIATKEDAASADLISREEAAAILAKLVANPNFKVITVFATSDIHSHLEPYKPKDAKREIGGLAHMSKIINDTRAIQPNTLLVDGGDAPYNTNIGNLFEGRSTIDVMNAMKYDAMVLGNHDFDFPFHVLESNAKRADFPFLSANTLYKGANPEFLQSYVIKELDGIKIGIVGITDDESHYYTHPKNVEGVSFQNEFEAARQTVDAVKDRTDVVIALAHMHGDNPVLPAKVGGIDVEIGGGQDVVEFPQIIGDTWLISPGKHAEVLNQINLNMMNGSMLGLNFAHIFLTENLEEDAAVASIIDEYRGQLDGKMQEVVGKTRVALDGERQTVRLKESNLGNAVADSLREMTGADIALQNGGGIRASINEGDITLENVYAALPFDNTVVMVEASGQTVWDALEHGVSWYPGAAGGFLQVSGLSYTFDASKEAGSRLVEVTVDGKPIDPTKIYKVVANDFLTGGGDKFTMLKDETKLLSKTKSYLRDAFYEYLQKHPTVSPQLEGRITVLNAAAAE